MGGGGGGGCIRFVEIHCVVTLLKQVRVGSDFNTSYSILINQPTNIDVIGNLFIAVTFILFFIYE